jgi:hypothetical protein
MLNEKDELFSIITPMRKSRERLTRKVRIDMKRDRFYTYRKISYGDKVKVVNTNPFNK